MAVLFSSSPASLNGSGKLRQPFRSDLSWYHRIFFFFTYGGFRQTGHL